MRPNTSPEALRRPSVSNMRIMLFEHVVLEAPVVLRQLAGERREGCLDRLHRGRQRRAEVAVLGRLEDHVEARAFPAASARGGA